MEHGGDTYISGVLGVSIAAYLPYCYFNFLSPLLDVAYGFVGFNFPNLALQRDRRPCQPAAEGLDGSTTPVHAHADPTVGPPV
jgi:NhaC family Na+:H+ antiporter